MILYFHSSCILDAEMELLADFIRLRPLMVYNFISRSKGFIWFAFFTSVFNKKSNKNQAKCLREGCMHQFIAQ